MRSFYIKALFWVIAVAAALCGRSQSSSKTIDNSQLDRRIEILLRLEFNIPIDYVVTFGQRKSSPLPGFDTLAITLSRNGKSNTIDFLISTDNSKIARMEEFDLTSDTLFSIGIVGRPIRGNPAARVTVVNFDDLECPFCARMHPALFPKTLQHYGNEVRFIYKDNPLVAIHPWAMHAAIDANCLAAQDADAYWQYLDYVHSHGSEISGETRNLTKSFASLDSIASEKGSAFNLDSSRLGECIQKQDETQVRASLKEAEALHIEGTPLLIVNGERVNGGAVAPEQLWLVIDRALRAVGIQPPSASPNISGKQATTIGGPHLSGPEEHIH